MWEKGTLRATIVNGEIKGHGRAVLTNTGAETFSGCTGIRKRQSAHTKRRWTQENANGAIAATMRKT
jgi:hypothetical protein